LYRAIISVPFPWSLKEWLVLSTHLNSLFCVEVVAGLNHLLIDVLRTEEDDPEGVLFIRTFLSRYISRGRPLSGYFILCCVIEAQWTILAQALMPVASEQDADAYPYGEAAAANKAWAMLLQEPIHDSLKDNEEYQDALRATIDSAMKCFTNLLVQIEDLGTEPSEDSYAWETMSESLVRLSFPSSLVFQALKVPLETGFYLLCCITSIRQSAFLESPALAERGFSSLR
jgi:phosphatidylinositol 4-kinase A